MVSELRFGLRSVAFLCCCATASCHGKSSGGGGSDTVAPPMQPASSQAGASASGPAPTAFTTADIQVPAGAQTFTSQQITVLLNSWSDLRSAHFSSGAGATTSNCLGTAVNALMVRATDTMLSIDQTFDLVSCLSTLESNDSSTVTLTTGTIHYVKTDTCANGGLAGFDGKTLAQVSAADPLAHCSGAQSYLTEIKISRVGSYAGTSATGQPVTGSITHNSVTYAGQSNLSPCQMSDDGTAFTTQSPCIHEQIDTLHTEISAQGAKTIVWVARTETSDLVESAQSISVWPNSGHKQITLENWTGTVTYTSAGTPPTYHLTSSDGSVIDGQVSPTAASNAKR